MVNHDMQLKFQFSPLREQRTILLMLRFIDEQWLLLIDLISTLGVH